MDFLGKAKYLLKIPFVYVNSWQGYLAIFGLLNQAKEYRYKMWNGLRFYTTGSKWDFFILNEIFVIREYDVKLKKDPAVIVDVGANIGSASLFFAKKYPKAKVYSIEPFESNFNRLEKNIYTNKLDDRIKAFNIAIGGKRAKMPLYICEDNNGCHTIVKSLNPNARRVEVDVESFEPFLKRNNISRVDLLKLDCEGAELPILNSIKDFSKIDNIVMEVTAGQMAEAKLLLEIKGFIVSQVEGRPLLFANRG